ncbi:MAG: TOMM precursor leader peptide-binding protein [Egibacteraceae bacterium]
MTTAAIAPGQTTTLGLAGQGLVHTALRRRLASACQVMPLDVGAYHADLDACSVVVLAADGWDPGLHACLNAECLTRGIPWLPAYIEPGRAVIGPCALPGQRGCVACAQMRQRAARQDAEEFSQLAERCAGELAVPSRSWLTTSTAELIAALVAEEVDRIATVPGKARTRNTLVCLDLAGLRTSVHRFLADPLCPVCGDPPDDTEEAARIMVRPRPKASPRGYRVRPLSHQKDRDRLLARYVDAEVGIVPSLTKAADSLFPNALAPVGSRRSFHRATGSGRSLDFQAAELTAVTEALERYGGLEPGSRRTVVQASYRQLGQQALDPTTLGLPSDEQYALPGSHFQRYHHDLILDWVWGYSFTTQRPVLVPERYAYYGLGHRQAPGQGFVYETSNGCALGGCMEEAILYGLLEVAERDAFLLTWYAMLGVPRIDPASLTDRVTVLMIERIEHVTGYTVHLFNTMVEQGIPCVWVMAVDEQNRADQPKALCAAGAHLDPERALVGALLELARHTQRSAQVYQDNRDRILAMVADPFKVRYMEDHGLLYSAPEAFERLSFLLDSPRKQTFADAFDHCRRPPSQDLSTDLRHAIAAYLDTGLDVIVIDHTTAEHAAEQFSCAKVIVPGTLAMTFGYHSQRVHGIDRLYRVPYELGYHPRPLTDADLNPHPHPFP